jgi:hypothetical protein
MEVIMEFARARDTAMVPATHSQSSLAPLTGLKSSNNTLLVLSQLTSVVYW